jgi:hypothetical protein
MVGDTIARPDVRAAKRRSALVDPIEPACVLKLDIANTRHAAAVAPRLAWHHKP